ncbi:hypothetical protein [Actibacterium pelagium]|uniref:Uncharacterized protein n=1 Tax=Actibacterium pelagium TaxID=2029103 RepID=A0A917EJS5_9RHOB|nr:hypothetical protein [Actibacterium pelagium]GGE52224.1 hypothetical protein GCM10011517_19980 [Actibacterium pelagium]
MENFEVSDIKRHKDGSINTAHYMAIGRRERALQARFIAKKLLAMRRMLIVGKTLAFPWAYANRENVKAV